VASVVFATHSSADSGAEQATVSTIAAWPSALPRPLLLLAEHGPIEERALRSEVDVEVALLDRRVASVRRHESGPVRLLRAVVGLLRHAGPVREVLDRRRADVLVATSIKALLFGWPAARRRRAAIVWSVHDRIHRSYLPGAAVLVLRHVAPRLVDGIVVNSRTTLETIRPGRTPVIVAAPTVPLDDRDFSEPGDDVRRVVVLGRLAPWKGQDLFLRAFARAFAGSATEAVVVGGALFGEDDYAASLHDEAERLGIADQVRFTGHLDDPWTELAEADVLVHCSRIPEPFGMVVVQGMWARCAVVATRPGGAAALVTDRQDGLLVPCDDEPALAEALAELRDDPALRRRLATAARATASAYRPEVVAPDLARWLDDLVLGRLAARSVARTPTVGGAASTPGSMAW
jgi:glycosyltransferase involved in cell wall biosynthesis